jgi:dihydroorotase
MIDEKKLNPLLFRMNPPIRSEVDRQFLFDLFKRDEVDFLATDHAPHTKEEKLKGISGLTGLDTFGPFCSYLLSVGVSPKVILNCCSKNPALHIGVKEYGKIDVGCSSIFTILNLNEKFSIDASYLKTKSSQSVWEFVSFPGKSFLLT